MNKDRKLDLSVRLMEHLVVPISVLDAAYRVMIRNRACGRLTGVKASEVSGAREHWRGFYSEPRPCLTDLTELGRSDEIAAILPRTTADGGLIVAERVCADIGH